MDKVTGSQPSIQSLRAQKAWEARRAAKPVATPEPTVQDTPSSIVDIQSVKPSSYSPVKSPSPSTNLQEQGLNIKEIQDIANRSGFVGVTEEAIQRAYTSGSSLLTDYRA